MRRIRLLNIAGIAVFCIQVAAFSAQTAEGKSVAVMALSAHAPEDRGLAVSLTETLYEAASSLAADRYALLAREQVKRMLDQKGIDTISCTEPCHVNAGTSIGVDFVFGGAVTRGEGSVKVVVELVEIGSGRLLGIKSVTAEDGQKLKESFRGAADELVEKLSSPQVAEAAPQEPQEEAEPETEGPEAPVQVVRVKFTSKPPGISVRVDGVRVCRRTPCFADVEVGEREIEMRAEYHQLRREIVKIRGKSHIRWNLTPSRYNYFGMHNLDDYGRLLTFGVWGTDERYRAVTVISGSDFANLSPVADVGFGGDIFTYHRNDNGSHWGILSFGPAIRIGRLIVESHLHVLSFRHRKTEPEVLTGWLPGLSTRASIPLINNR